MAEVSTDVGLCVLCEPAVEVRTDGGLCRVWEPLETGAVLRPDGRDTVMVDENAALDAVAAPVLVAAEGTSVGDLPGIERLSAVVASVGEGKACEEDDADAFETTTEVVIGDAAELVLATDADEVNTAAGV